MKTKSIFSPQKAGSDKGKKNLLSYPRKVLIYLVLGLSVVFAGCAKSNNVPDPEPSPISTLPPTSTTVPISTPEPSPTPTEEPSMAVTTLQDVRLATIQIESEGTFMDPEIGSMQVFAGLGSGFIIDESGLAVTNNHVVSGAAILKVRVHGIAEPLNARVLGVSECSDLAVIDIEGDGFPYLEWYEAPITVSTDVYAAGFPLGDPEFTLTRGIVSKEHANGQVSWASVEYVIEHDATINPGNSGGPLVTSDGRVVGINYAAYQEADQSFAIARDEAFAVIDELKVGNNVDSIGVNGLAVTDGVEMSGIWVASVRSGSPADFAGIHPGDIILKMEGLDLGENGTMATYCDIIRTHNQEDALTVEVLRIETGEVLKGQLNGQQLEVIDSLAGEADDNPAGIAEDGSYSEYVLVTDDHNLIELEIPAAWSEVDGRLWVIDGEILGATVSAAADLEAFNSTWTEPGVFFGASHELARMGGYVQLLDSASNFTRQDCEFDGRYDYDDGIYDGKYDVWTNCGGVGTTYIIISAVPKENRTDYLILVGIQITQEAELEALEHIVDSFMVIGDLEALSEEL